MRTRNILRLFATTTPTLTLVVHSWRDFKQLHAIDELRCALVAAARNATECERNEFRGREFVPVTEKAALLAGSGGESPHRRFCNFRGHTTVSSFAAVQRNCSPPHRSQFLALTAGRFVPSAAPVIDSETEFARDAAAVMRIAAKTTEIRVHRMLSLLNLGIVASLHAVPTGIRTLTAIPTTSEYELGPRSPQTTRARICGE